MTPYIYPLTKPFNMVTGELLPEYRDAYLLGQLKPTVALQVEQYLSKSTIQTSLALARYHELADAAKLKGRTVSAPFWVQQQLLLQPLVSAAGPLRRPVVRMAAALFLALSVASGVQWVRNKPLVPAPVAAAVTQAARSVSQASQALISHFSVPQQENKARVNTPAQRVSTAQKASMRPSQAQLLAKGMRPAGTATLAAGPVDSLAIVRSATVRDSSASTANTLAPSTKTSEAPRAVPATGTVRGYIHDNQGHPLVGATVLVKSTLRGASTDASGQYIVEAPAGATLQYGYAGYTDLLRSATLGTMNVVLMPNVTASSRSNK